MKHDGTRGPGGQLDNHEIALIRQAQSGDSRAFEQLMGLHDRRIFRLALGMVNSRQDAEEVYQETFLRAFTRIATFRFESTFGTWLCRIAINQAISLRRRHRWRRWVSWGDEESGEPGGVALAPVEPDPEESVVSQEMVQTIYREIERLPDRQRTVFLLKHVQGYSIAEIAECLDCPQGTVTNALFRAVHKLRHRLRTCGMR